MSDIMFLAKKEYDTKLKQNDGTRTTTGTLCTLTASGSKDMCLAMVKVGVFDGNISTNEVATIDLTIDTTIVESAKIGGTGDISGSFPYEFISKGFKVIAGKTIKLEVSAVVGTPEIYGAIICWEEPTNGDPVI